MQEAGRSSNAAEKMTALPLTSLRVRLVSATFASRMDADAGSGEMRNEPVSLAASSQEQELAVAPREFVLPRDCRPDRKSRR